MGLNSSCKRYAVSSMLECSKLCCVWFIDVKMSTESSTDGVRTIVMSGIYSLSLTQSISIVFAVGNVFKSSRTNSMCNLKPISEIQLICLNVPHSNGAYCRQCQTNV